MGVSTIELETDPGWRLDRVGLTRLVLPHLALNRTTGDGLVDLRHQFLSAVPIVVMFSGLGAYGGAQRSVAWGALVSMAVFTIATMSIAIPRLRSRTRLDPATPAALATTFRERLITRIFTAQAPALVLSVIGVATRQWWLPLVGLVVTIVLMIAIAPTTFRLGAEQRRLVDAGCRTSLIAALRQAKWDRLAGGRSA